MKYEQADDIAEIARQVISKLRLDHIDTENISCIRSHGSKARRVIARCHALGKVMQKAMGRKAFYVLEFLSERFDNQSEEDRTKIIIHELMHIPNSFGGGFKHHDFVTPENVDKFYNEFIKN